ncbi:Ig-like domain-containing protein [Serratia fonticola]|uniref:Ig-like domain-containing protein n=1 Tax=Serratia fonticola TaxID=47917 RepID=UPI00301D3CBF
MRRRVAVSLAGLIGLLPLWGAALLAAPSATSPPDGLLRAVTPLGGDGEMRWPLNAGFPSVAMPGARFQLVTALPASTLHWRSSDPSLATVDPQTGVVTLHARGAVTVTVSQPGGTAQAQYTVTPKVWLTAPDTHLRSWKQADAFCREKALRLPQVSTLTSAQWASPGSHRLVGHLWDEWGNLTRTAEQGGYGWLNGLYWSSTLHGEGHYFAVELVTGQRFSQGAALRLATVCEVPPPPEPALIVASVRAGTSTEPVTDMKAGFPQGGYSGATLHFQVAPDTGSHPLHWQSSNPAVATVTPEGTVTLHQQGLATLRVDDEQTHTYETYPLDLRHWWTPIDMKTYPASAIDGLCQARQGRLVTESEMLAPLPDGGLRAEWGTAFEDGAAATTAPWYWVQQATGRALLNLHTGLTAPAEAQSQGRIICASAAAEPALTVQGMSVATEAASIPWSPTSGFPRTGFPGATMRIALSGVTDPLSWRSSNVAIASVDNGTVTLHAPGEAQITATSGTRSTSVDLNVTQWFVPATSPHPMSWDRASESCAQMGGLLPTVQALTSAPGPLRVPVKRQVGYLWDEWGKASSADAQIWSASAQGDYRHDVVSLQEGARGFASDNLAMGVVCAIPPSPTTPPVYAPALSSETPTASGSQDPGR